MKKKIVDSARFLHAVFEKVTDAGWWGDHIVACLYTCAIAIPLLYHLEWPTWLQSWYWPYWRWPIVIAFCIYAAVSYQMYDSLWHFLIDLIEGWIGACLWILAF